MGDNFPSLLLKTDIVESRSTGDTFSHRPSVTDTEGSNMDLPDLHTCSGSETLNIPSVKSRCFSAPWEHKEAHTANHSEWLCGSTQMSIGINTCICVLHSSECRISLSMAACTWLLHLSGHEKKKTLGFYTRHILKPPNIRMHEVEKYLS